MVTMRVVVVHVVLQPSVTEAAVETVLLHFRVCAICVPSVVSNSVDSGHRAGPVPAAVTVDEHGLIRRIVYNFQELRRFIRRGPGAIAHADAEELHSRRLYQSLLISLTVIL